MTCLKFFSLFFDFVVLFQGAWELPGRLSSAGRPTSASAGRPTGFFGFPLGAAVEGAVVEGAAVEEYFFAMWVNVGVCGFWFWLFVVR